MTDQKSFFASKSLASHLLRGAIGAAALWYAFASFSSCYLCAIAGIIVALLAFRGCPVCWTVGLLETSCRIPKAKAGAAADEKDSSPPQAKA